MAAGGSRGGSPILKVRIPADSWVWTVADGHRRAEEVRRALFWYGRYRERLEVVSPSTLEEVCSYLGTVIGLLQEWRGNLEAFKAELAVFRPRRRRRRPPEGPGGGVPPGAGAGQPTT